ncbi:MAG: hypothetical protein ABII98_01075 [bacterium]
MKTITLDEIKFPAYFEKDFEKTKKANYELFLSRGVDKEEAEKLMQKKINYYELVCSSIMNTLQISLKNKFNDAVPFSVRKSFAKIVEKVYDAEKEIELSDEQFDLIFEAFQGDLGLSTAEIVIAEYLEQIKLREIKKELQETGEEENNK